MTIPDAPPHAWAEAKRMFQTGTFSMQQIVRKTGLSKTAVYDRAARDGWKKPETISKVFTPTNVERSVAARASATIKGIVREPLPGSSPVPFHAVPKGCCVFILGDMPGEMDMALTCALPGHPYCEGHQELCGGGTQYSSKPGVAARELARSLRRYIAP